MSRGEYTSEEGNVRRYLCYWAECDGINCNTSELLLAFEFYGRVWFWDQEAKTDMTDKQALFVHWLGIAHHVGIDMTYWIQTDSGCVIAWSTVQHITISDMAMIISMHYKLRMFGIPLEGPAQVYCDNQGVVKNTSIPESVLS